MTDGAAAPKMAARHGVMPPTPGATGSPTTAGVSHDPTTMRTAVLAVLGGVSRRTVARRLGVDDATLARWADRFIAAGGQALAELADAAGDGRSAGVDVARDHHLAVVAHELRSPLAMIGGWAGLIAREPENADLVRRAAAGISAQSIRLGRLAEDTMDASAVALGAVEVQTTRVKLGDLVRHVAGARAVDPPEVTVVQDACVQVDADRIGQVLDNLLENARKHAGTRASITVARDGADAVVRLATPGRPIPADTAGRLFEPWQRGRTAVGGAGLGLYICRTLVEAHDGSVGLDVDEDGNTFWVRLPALDAA